MERIKRKLTDLCSIQYGYAFDSKKFTDDSTCIPLIRIRDVKPGISNTFYAGEYDESYIVNAGDVLIGMDGEFNIAKWKSIPSLLNQRVCRITANNDVDTDYLQYYMSVALKKIEARTAFVTVKHLSAKELTALELNIPCLDEQREISRQLRLVEDVIGKRKEQLAALEQLIRSQFIEMFGEPNTNPKAFPVQAINQIGNCVAGATPSTSVAEYWDNGSIPWMSSGEVNLGRIYMTEKKITQLGYDSSSTKMIPAHTVVIAMAGQGKTRGTVGVAEIELCTNQSLCSVITDNTVLTDYLYYYLKLQYNELRNISNGDGGRGGLNLKLIGSFKIMVPPIETQNKFSVFVQQIDKQKVILQQSLNELETEFKALMQQAFSNELSSEQ